jgi:hypothetical protein
MARLRPRGKKHRTWGTENKDQGVNLIPERVHCKMEDVSLVIIPCAPADPDQVAAAKAEFQGALETSQKESASLGCVGIKGFGPNCRRLFYHGVDVSRFYSLAPFRLLTSGS